MSSSLPPTWSAVFLTDDDEDVVAPSTYPEVVDAETLQALQDFLSPPPSSSSSSSSTPHLSDAALEDLLCGHCETCAIALASSVLANLSLPDALQRGYSSLASSLESLSSSPAQQIALLFEAEKRAVMQDAAAAAKEEEEEESEEAAHPSNRRQRLMWSPLLGPSASSQWPVDASWDPESHLLAGSSSAKDFIFSVAAAAADVVVGVGGPPSSSSDDHHPENEDDAIPSAAAASAAVPLYVLNYIFDGNELSSSDLSLTSAVPETAQFSLHVLALVFDNKNKRVLVADPNGRLLEGGNMEFLVLPVERLQKGRKETTSLSQYDIEQLQAQKASRDKEKKKKKQRTTTTTTTTKTTK